MQKLRIVRESGITFLEVALFIGIVVMMACVFSAPTSPFARVFVAQFSLVVTVAETALAAMRKNDQGTLAFLVFSFLSVMNNMLLAFR